MNIEQLLYEAEGTSLDFKSRQYPFSHASAAEKSELLKDIIAFSNAWRRETAYILVGVKEAVGKRAEVQGITDTIDDSRIQQFVGNKINRPIEFRYFEMKLEEKLIGVFEIPVQKERPYFLKKRFANLDSNAVYIRRGSATEIANPDEIRKMGIVAIANGDPILEFGFYDSENEIEIGPEIDIVAKVIQTPEQESIPDYGKTEPTTIYGYDPLGDRVNKDYYRELARWISFQSQHKNVSYTISKTLDQLPCIT